MNFHLYGGFWIVQFLEHDCRTSLPRKQHFSDPEKIRDLNNRFGSRVAEDLSTLDYAITNGRGAVWLMLGLEQYRVLRQPPALAGK